MTKPRKDSTRQKYRAKSVVGVEGRGHRWRTPGICMALAAITFAVFGQTLGHDFIDFDDDEYVYANPVVVRGLTLKGLVWAFTQSDASNWHPLTWLSHMLDCQLYGLNPGGHHLTNVLLHTAAVIGLFLVLRGTTGALWRSAFVAAVFAIHPLRAESVAWVAERKDVLSGVFFVLTIGAYARYARRPWSALRYGLVIFLYVLGLMCKPMLVTLPLVLLLLDYWPLQRAEPARRLVVEKLPLLALSAASCVATFLAQGGAIQSTTSIPVLLRLGNALVACVIYLRQMVWPSGLAMCYPYPDKGLSGYEVGLAAALLVGLSAVGWRERRARPWLLMGWLWYLVMLLPVLGIIQAGVQAHADRYTYLPQIGLYVALAWLAAEWAAKFHAGHWTTGSLMALVLGALLICAWKQTAYWKNSETLWTHTLACTAANCVAHNSLGNALEQMGKAEDAISHYEQAVAIKPDYAEAHANLGNALDQKGRVDEAEAQFQKALQIDPSNPAFENNLAWLLATCPQASLRDGARAVALAQQANAATGGGNLVILRTLAAALAEAGRFGDARQTAQKALELARASGRQDLAGQLSHELEQYQTGLPVHQ
jgi:protein O-mannosyl-transferase